MSDIGVMENLFRDLVWTAAVLVGLVVAIIERAVLKRHLLWILLVLIALTGVVITAMNPFTFGSGDDYMTGIIISGGAMLAGYAFTAFVGMALRQLRKRST